MSAFNLLRHPDLAAQRRRWHRQWTALAGLAAGLAVAWWVTGTVHELSSQTVQERSSLQAKLEALQVQQLAHQNLQVLQNKWLVQSSYLSHLDRQHQTWLAVYRALQKEAGPGSVQLLRLQLDAHNLEMQGNARDVHSMDKAHQALSVSLAQHLNPVLILSSWVDKQPSGGETILRGEGQERAQLLPQTSGSGNGLEFVWQSGWPVVSASPQPKVLTQASPSSEQGQDPP